MVNALSNSLNLVGDGDEIDILEDIEGVFDVRFSDDEAERCETLGDVHDVLTACGRRASSGLSHGDYLLPVATQPRGSLWPDSGLPTNVVGSDIASPEIREIRPCHREKLGHDHAES